MLTSTTKDSNGDCSRSAGPYEDFQIKPLPIQFVYRPEYLYYRPVYYATQRAITEDNLQDLVVLPSASLNVFPRSNYALQKFNVAQERGWGRCTTDTRTAAMENDFQVCC